MSNNMQSNSNISSNNNIQYNINSTNNNNFQNNNNMQNTINSNYNNNFQRINNTLYNDDIHNNYNIQHNNNIHYNNNIPNTNNIQNIYNNNNIQSMNYILNINNNQNNNGILYNHNFQNMNDIQNNGNILNTGNIQINNGIQYNNNIIQINNQIQNNNMNLNDNIQNNHNNINSINNIQLNNSNNNFQLDNTRKDIFPEKGKLFNIIEAENEIYIANTNKFELIKILKDDTSIIERINKQTEIPRNIIQITQADAIIGIFDLNWIKYLGIVTFSEESATILNSKIYSIKSIELIQITKTKEFPYNEELKENIKDLFSTKNFYYSNDYKLSLSLNQHEQETINKKYSVNYSMLTSFFENNIPEYFYAQIILGLVSSENNIEFENSQSSIDIIIIERYFYENIIRRNNYLMYIKQVEFISIFKRKNNNDGENEFFSFICYENGETANNINSFVPFKVSIVEELNQFQNITCIINNLNDNIKTKQLDNLIKNNNKGWLNNKIKITSVASNWKKNFFEDFNFVEQLDFFSKKNIQQNCFWFIDINNTDLENNRCLESFKILFWTIIQKEIDYQKLNINIRKFDKNNKNIIYQSFKELTDLYKVKININNSLLLLYDKEIFHEIIDKYLKDNKIPKEDSQNLNKIKILCITWNVGGQPLENDYDISAIFKKNHFYIHGQFPDIVVISLQEIVNLNITNTLKSDNNKEFIEKLSKKLIDTLNKVFPEQNYTHSGENDLVGLYGILLMRKAFLKGKINILDISENKTGKFNLGNKGFITFGFQYKNRILFSIVSGHLESGFEKNNKRIETLKGILNKEITTDSNRIRRFKESDFWIILGDLNFRIGIKSYDLAMNLIMEKNYNSLYCMDQFHLAYENNEFLKNNINEGTLNFEPTYKFEKNSDNYTYDKAKIRVPAWCDRIFYCKKDAIKIMSYDSAPNLKLSDHRPVIAAFEVFPDKI